MKRLSLWYLLAFLLLAAGVVLFLKLVTTSSNSVNDLTESERRGYPGRTVLSGEATTTASSTQGCVSLAIQTCPVDQWLTYSDPEGLFQFKYPLAPELASADQVARVDFGYPRSLRVTTRVIDGSYTDAVSRLENSAAYGQNGGTKHKLTVAGREAVTVSDNSDPGWLTYVPLTSDRTLFLIAEFTEDYDADQALYGRFLSTLRIK